MTGTGLGILMVWIELAEDESTGEDMEKVESTGLDQRVDRVGNYRLENRVRNPASVLWLRATL